MTSSKALRAGAAWLDQHPTAWAAGPTNPLSVCAVFACSRAIDEAPLPFQWPLREEIIHYNDYEAKDVHDVIVFMRTLADLIEGKHVEL